MKLQRAEVRKIHETQRKVDNEEVSDEEEEEDFEDDEGKANFLFFVLVNCICMCASCEQMH